jgi:Ca2+-binding EF-hand superfamily protein
MSRFNISAKRVTAASALIIFMSGTALADQTGKMRFDSNGDQEISKTEFLAGATARFDAGDVNQDNFLSDDERKAQREANRDARKDRRFAKTDLNGDGQISKEEFDTVREARREKSKQRRDINGDGLVDKADKRKSRREAGLKGPDANQDGFVSREEHMAAAERMFVFLDANGDGVLSQGEGAKRRARRFKKKQR